MKRFCSFLMLMGRLLISLIFLWGGISKLLHWEASIQFVVANELPMAWLVAIASCLVQLLGGISLLLGFKVRWGAGLLFIMLIPVSFYLHDFWAFEGIDAHIQKLYFMKNLAIMGGLLYVISCGAGNCALDKSCSSCKSQ